MKIFKFKCKCGKVIKSIYKGQFDWNKKQHLESCKVK